MKLLCGIFPTTGYIMPKNLTNNVWFLDCSARYEGKSLNDCLLQGPDLTNSMLGVLCRFRQEKVAFLCDVDEKFFQFRVNEEHRDYIYVSSGGKTGHMNDRVRSVRLPVTSTLDWETNAPRDV